jgi:hypothetical protein
MLNENECHSDHAKGYILYWLNSTWIHLVKWFCSLNNIILLPEFSHTYNNSKIKDHNFVENGSDSENEINNTRGQQFLWKSARQSIKLPKLLVITPSRNSGKIFKFSLWKLSILADEQSCTKGRWRIPNFRSRRTVSFLNPELCL